MSISFRHVNQNTYLAKSPKELPFITLTYTASGSPRTLDIDNLAVAAGEKVTVVWGDGSRNTYSGEASRSHVYNNAGVYTIKFIGYKHLTKLSIIDIAGVGGDVSTWVLWDNLIWLGLGNSTVYGNITDWVFPSGMEYFFIHGTSVTADVTSWVVPSGMVQVYLSNTVISGSTSGWEIPASMVRLYFNSTSVDGTPDLSSAEALWSFQYQDCGLPEANVDSVLEAVYNRRLAFTNTAPLLNLGSDNETPSGIYQDADPPTTGLEYTHVLANDTSGEGFFTWIITYNGGVAP